MLATYKNMDNIYVYKKCYIYIFSLYDKMGNKPV